MTESESKLRQNLAKIMSKYFKYNAGDYTLNSWTKCILYDIIIIIVIELNKNMRLAYVVL